MCFWSTGIIEEEDDINLVEETFRQAYKNSQADTIHVPGLQEFAGSVSILPSMISCLSAMLACMMWLELRSIASDMQIWARRQNTSAGRDPLDRIFSEFDEDDDGYLDAEDVTAALSSRNVNITPEQAQMFLEGKLAACATYQTFKLQGILLEGKLVHNILCPWFAVSDVDSDHKVGRHEFDDFIFHMAAADLAHGSQPLQEVCIFHLSAGRVDHARPVNIVNADTPF